MVSHSIIEIKKVEKKAIDSIEQAKYNSKELIEKGKINAADDQMGKRPNRDDRPEEIA